MSRPFKSALTVIFVLAWALPVFSQSPDRRETSGTGKLIASGANFDVYSEGGADAYSVLSKIDFNYLVYSGSVSGNENAADILAKTIDGLYQEVSDILDIHIYSYKGVIQVYPDKQSIADLFKNSYGIDFFERSVYYFEKDVIYISLADMTVGILGHEMAHAIISHFFVVPPPAKIQEVLCGYVEYSLRKTRGTLP